MTSQLLRRLGVVTAAVLVVAFGAAAPAQAESTTGSISGHVTRPDGSPAPSELVFARDVNSENPGGAAVTDENGFYFIIDLVPGSYRVSIPRGSQTQYAHGKTSSSTADVFVVTAGEVTAVDEQLLALGTLQIVVTEADGAPARGEVSLHNLDQSFGSSARLDESGQASLNVFPGEYKVQVVPAIPGDPDNLDFARAQWLHGATSFEQGEVVAVTPDTTTAVAERLLPSGAVTVTARDSMDGSPIVNFCARVADREWCSDGSGSVTLTGLLPATHDLEVFTHDGLYLPTDATVTIVAGETVPAVVDLVPGGAITTTVVDAITGQPVAGACLIPVPMGSGRVGDAGGDCTGVDGQTTLGPLLGGVYHLFVVPETGSGYGAQWVGWMGGVGDPARARGVTVEPRAVAAMPSVKLDRAGTISGTVTSAATRQPVTSGHVSLFPYGNGSPAFDSEIDESGRYSLDWLGPYEWPLVFTTLDHARQWSGGVADRREAKQIKVQSGKTTTYSPALKVGTVMTGTVTDATGNPLTIDFDVINAATGDNMGSGFSPGGTYRSLILGPQTIKINWRLHNETTSHEGWYDDDIDFEHAKPIDVPKKGTLTVDLMIATG
ncbi:Carboxypeptidase regulatory-like domain-containing protein [Micromonospora rhizosphaerae]|uniref:Carboxypeptidase regulatory-like domain-containing protein n=1 Tax=Micromonospora rhizosphaerae TaxID=568872 RepID=A0A1C6T331_9ACTN|nr:carboxypeptidase-like regulatory domain-containing protein [Micromonospora rhizosphaerae]SCL36178.1 Carboxypeptidase regulatory-like domain-containing protein [Micromonospora rhizosphaerae]